MKRQRSDTGDKKQQQVSIFNKIQQLLLSIFTRDAKLLTQASTLKLAVVYAQILILIHILCQYTVFRQTNNPTYCLLTAILSILQIVFYVIPRLSAKHVALKILGVLIVLCGLGQLVLTFSLITNYTWFRYVCGCLNDYYARNPMKSQVGFATCQNITIQYIGQMAESFFVVVIPGVITMLTVRAYSATKKAFDEEQTKKRRKDRYNQLLLQRHVYNDKRMI